MEPASKFKAAWRALLYYVCMNLGDKYKMVPRKGFYGKINRMDDDAVDTGNFQASGAFLVKRMFDVAWLSIRSYLDSFFSRRILLKINVSSSERARQQYKRTFI